jgi:hypothetical protein
MVYQNEYNCYRFLEIFFMWRIFAAVFFQNGRSYHVKRKQQGKIFVGLYPDATLRQKIY